MNLYAEYLEGNRKAQLANLDRIQKTKATKPPCGTERRIECTLHVLKYEARSVTSDHNRELWDKQ